MQGCLKMIPRDATFLLRIYFITNFSRVIFFKLHSFFFIRTSNFDAEAERSYIFWRFEAETFLKMFIEDPSLGPQKDDVDVIWGLSSIPFKTRHV